MKSKVLKILSTITNILCSLVLVVSTIGTIYFIKASSAAPKLNIETITKKKSSKIYDNSNNFVKQLTMEDYENITYSQLPDVFINALLSCEDIRFFMHEGIDLPRILSALKTDISSMSLKQGASTITQQLVKNMMLTNQKSIERKIQEVYLANQIEILYSKKDIIEFYCNYVCFDGINHGALTASYKFFNKHIKDLTLPEAALLVGVANAPTFYSPLVNKQNAYKRKNIVLKLMQQHGYIDQYTCDSACEISIDDMIYTKEKKQDEKVYPYQSYIDIVYKQILEKTGYDPYNMPMEIYTNMDSVLQTEIDAMQNGSLTFANDLQQFASCIIANDTGNIVATFGKRNYKGQKLLNLSYDSLFQPGSTIKIPLDYALAFEYLNFNNMEVLKDIPTYYPNTNISIHNVDHSYLGEILIADAIGYSRNTTAISTLKKVADKISIEKINDYLNDIHLMDDGIFSYAYGLGGYKNGVSVTNLAAAYSMIARGGTYIEPLAVRKIKLLDGSEKEINFTPKTKKVLSNATCYLITDVLNQVMENNYWKINDCKPSGINVYAKTGTTSFDSSLLKKNNYPSNASKDRWLASYTKDYTIACWTGFENYLKDKKTYFSSGSTNGNIVKTFTKMMYSKIAKKHQTFEMPEGLQYAYVVRGSDLLATSQVEKDYIVKALYKSSDMPKKYFIEPLIEENVIFDYFILGNEISFIFNKEKKQESEYNVLFDYEKILGGKQTLIDIYYNGVFLETVECEQIKTISLQDGFYNFEIYYKYKNGFNSGPKQTLSFTYT